MRTLLAELLKRDAPLMLRIIMGASALLFGLLGMVWELHTEAVDFKLNSLRAEQIELRHALEQREWRVTTMEAGYGVLKERTDDQEDRLRQLEHSAIRQNVLKGTKNDRG